MKAMKIVKCSMLLVIMGAFCLWSVQAGATTISNLYNTGQSLMGQADPNYTLSMNPNDTSHDAFVVGDAWPVQVGGPWAPNGPNSNWIAPVFTPGTSPLVSNAAGNYIYSTTFNLAFVPGSALITGKWWTDNNMGGILFNGHFVSSSIVSGDNLSMSPRDFTISDYSWFLQGTNTLQFLVTNLNVGPDNVGNPTGLRVEFTTKEAGPSPVPLPPAVLLLGSGLLGLSFIRRKIKG